MTICAGDEIISFGEMKENQESFCTEEGRKNSVLGHIGIVEFTCQVNRSGRINSVEILLKGNPDEIGGANIIQGGIGEQNVTVYIHGKTNKVLRYAVNVYAEPNDFSSTTSVL